MKPGEIARHITRGAFFLVLEKGTTFLAGTLYLAITLRWLGPTHYGHLSLALAIVTFATVLTGNFEEFLQRYAAEYPARRRFDLLGRALRVALAFKLVLGALATVALVVGAGLLARHFSMPELGELVPALVLIVATDGFATTGRAVLIGLQRYEWVGGVSIAFNLAKALMVGVLYGAHRHVLALAIGLSVLAVFQAALFSIAAAIVLRQARQASRHEPTVERESDRQPILKQIVSYCLPLLGARASFLSGQNLGRIVLASVLDATQLGYYTFAFQTVDRFVDLLSAIPSTLLPSLTHLVAREERERLRWIFDQAFRLVQVLACALSFALFAFAPELTLWVGSPLFAASVPILRVLALVPIARTAQQPLTMLFQALRRPGLVLSLAVLKLVVELACYFALVTWMGPLGAAWANLLGAVASYVVALMLLAAVLPEGAGERAQAVLRSVLLLGPALIATSVVHQQLGPGATSLALRVLCIAPTLLAIFALGLVTRYDLQKLSSLPVRARWLRTVRDVCVDAADRVARMFEPRRAA